VASHRQLLGLDADWRRAPRDGELAVHLQADTKDRETSRSGKGEQQVKPVHRLTAYLSFPCAPVEKNHPLSVSLPCCSREQGFVAVL